MTCLRCNHGTARRFETYGRLRIQRFHKIERISTSDVERANLSVRMHLRRFTRLTNAHSKTLLHLKAAVSLYIAFYNFVRVHQTIRLTPAMQAALTDHVWTIQELITASV